jgi:hypothetical protein
MKHNLTLSLDADLIRQAQIMAAQQSLSLTQMLSDKLTHLIACAQEPEPAPQRALTNLKVSGPPEENSNTPTTSSPPPSPLMDPFWHSPSLEDLARAQGVKPINNLEEIMGGWPEEEIDDGFEEAVLRWRQVGL